ncbi:MAG: UDP-N-acetylmuramoyl-L-alanine--D-glutamate ligase [Deltaproteobacteria bacterium]|nr:MAG: UDP-N-acetylmuramoyl-L-alanine--D-glutamate ligase [Deltaproteobacteria bacterium]
MEDFRDKKVLVVGLAKTGLATAEFLLSKGARVTVTDHLSASELGSTADSAKSLGCSLALGGHPVEVFTQADLIVVSPGVPLELPELKEAQSRSIPIIGELELASRFLQLPIVAISGTNGKTTTTALVGDMLKHSGKRVFVGGNIGNPLISIFKEKEPFELAVVEVSSFQLDSMATFHPQVAVLLNISEDHLDRYPSFADYVESKCRLFANQTAEDTAVVPARDPLITVRCTIPSRQLNFSPTKNSAHAYLESGWLMCRVMPGPLRRYDLNRWQLFGKHNQQNLLAAVLAATSMGAKPEAIQKTIDSFKPLPHRMELVHHWRGIRFYDDSKGTNVDSVVRSLESFSSPIILIAGGRDKEGSYDPLVSLVRQRVKMLVLIGEARFRLAKALGKLSCTVVVEEMDAAVQVALGAAVAGDVVLLSPACSSFDQYEDYKARGDHFRTLVHKYTAMESGVEILNSPWVSSRKNNRKLNAHN